MFNSVHPANLFQLFNPYFCHQRMFLGNGYDTLYGGSVVTAMVFWLFVRYRKISVNKLLVICFALVAVLGVAMSFGRYSALYSIVSALPILDRLRGAARHGAMFHIAWVCLASFAFAELLRLRRAKRVAGWDELLPLALLPGIGFLVALVVAVAHGLADTNDFTRFLNAEFAPTRNALAGALIVALGTGVFAYAARGRPLGLIALVLFTLADLSVYGLRHRTTGDLDEFIAQIDLPPDTPEFGYEPDYLPMYSVMGPATKGYRTTAGLASIVPARKLEYYLNEAPLRAAGVRWLRVRYGTNRELNALHDQGVQWLELPDPMPRARLVSHTERSLDPNARIHEIQLATTALTETEIPLPQSTPGVATVTEDRPGRIAIHTTAPARQLLVLTESYDPGWRVKIDGTSQAVVPVYGDFLGVLVDEGEHDAQFVFDPASYRSGKILTLAGLLAALVLHALLYAFLVRSELREAS